MAVCDFVGYICRHHVCRMWCADSGNHAGDSGARALSKLLQLNQKLSVLHWDRNNTPPQGFCDVAAAMQRWCFVMLCGTLCNAASPHGLHDILHLVIGSRPSDHYSHSVCWFVSVCLFISLCRVFLSRLWSDFDQTRTYVICLGLVVSPRIQGCATPGAGWPLKNLYFRSFWAQKLFCPTVLIGLS